MNALQATQSVYNELLQATDTVTIHRQLEQLQGNLKLAQGCLVNAEDQWDYDSIKQDIETLEKAIEGKTLALQLAKKRNGQLTQAEAKELATVYNKDFAPHIKRYDELNKQLLSTVEGFIEEVEKLTDEMIQIERMELMSTPIRGMVAAHNNVEIKQLPKDRHYFSPSRLGVAFNKPTPSTKAQMLRELVTTTLKSIGGVK